MEKALKIKQIVVVLIAIAAVAIGYYMFQSITSPAKAVAKQENVVQLASEQPKVEMNKTHQVVLMEKKEKLLILHLTMGQGNIRWIIKYAKTTWCEGDVLLIGANVKEFPDLVKRENAEGHYVGMHSMTHNFAKLYKNGEYVNEMKEDQGLIANIIGKSPKLTRPPYGSMPGLNEGLRNKVVEGGFKVWDWTIDSLDWKYNKMPVDAAAAQIAQNVLTNATKPQEVILMHDIHPQSVAAVPAILKGLKEKGYEFEAYHEESHFPVNFWHDNRM